MHTEQPQQPQSESASVAQKPRWRVRAWWMAWGVTAVGIAAVWSIDHTAYRTLKIQYDAATAAHEQLAQQVDRLRGDYRRLLEAVSASQAKTQDLTRALSAKEDALRQTETRMRQADLVMQELQERLAVVQHHFDLLQEEYMLSMHSRDEEHLGRASQIELEKVVVIPQSSTATGWEGRVVAVHPEWQFIVVDLGWETVNLGDVVAIYHGSQIVAKARIERVQKEASVATLLPEWTADQITVNDAVRAL